MRNKITSLLLLILISFPALSVWNAIQIVRGPDSLAYCEIVPPKSLLLDATAPTIVGKTAFGSEFPFTLDRGAYRIVIANDSGKRAIVSISVIVNSQSSSIPSSGWTIILREQTEVRETEATLTASSPGTYVLKARKAEYSRVIAKHRATLNWIGDDSVAMIALTRSAILLVKTTVVLAILCFSWGASSRLSIHQQM